MKLFLSVLGIVLAQYMSNAISWHIGNTQTYTLPGQVRNLVGDGDTVLIDGGIYLNDAVKWTKNSLTFIGLGSGNNRTIIKYSGDIPNGKGIWVFESPGSNDNIYIDNIVFDGAQVSDNDGGNGAGIRFQANNLSINNCKFLNCQNGILEGHGNISTSNVIIQNSEFYNNGYQEQDDPNHSGYEHHIYISGGADTLLVQNCYFHHPRGQANSLKTRAQNSFILYNYIDEEETGYGSWEINIAQGGMNVIIGNVIIQGPAGANHGIIGYDEASNLFEELYFINNTVINKYAGNIKFFNTVPASGINIFKISNNIFASVPGANNTMFTGNIPAVLDTSNNILAQDYLQLGFKDPESNDFSLTAVSNAIDHGTDPGFSNTFYPLNPIHMYLSFEDDLLSRNISGTAIDIGAFEFVTLNSNSHLGSEKNINIYPNPSGGSFRLGLNSLSASSNCLIEIFDSKGQKLDNHLHSGTDDIVDMDLSKYNKGLYLIRICCGKDSFTSKIIVQ